MDEGKRVVAKMVENGQYFTDAQEWYASKYLHLYTQRAYMGILAIISAVFAALIIQMNLLDTIALKYPFPIYATDEAQYFSKISSISQQDEPIAISVARYLSAQYVIKRESYNYNIIGNHKNWEEELKEVRQLSSRQVFDRYLYDFSPDTNPNSPILIFKDNSKRIIKVEEVHFPKIEESIGSAIVYYTALDEGQVTGTSSWAASLSFSITNLDSVINQHIPLQFTVTNYHTSQITSDKNKSIF